MRKYSLFTLIFLIAHTVSAQISFTNQTATILNGNTHNSFYPMGVADMNGDMLDDIVVIGSTNLYVYHQQSSGVFNQMISLAGDLGQEWGMTIADADQNGFNDILVGGFNNGLKYITANSNGTAYNLSTLGANIFLQGTNFADINNDGHVDLFTCHDNGLSPVWKNNGSGGFSIDYSLINTASTVPSDNSGNYASVWIDYDNDGDLDMYLSKCRSGVTDPLDGRRLNLLFQNNGQNQFTEVAPAAGLQPQGQSWATDFGDFDNDGDLDCVIINHDIPTMIFKNNGNGTFSNVTSSSGFSSILTNYSGGIQVFLEDFDNDCYLDILLTTNSSSSNFYLLRNNGDFTFSESDNSIAFFGNSNNMLSGATGDLNNDGFIDIYASHKSTNDKVWINDGNMNNHVSYLLKGDDCNINGIGARVELYGAWGKQIREVRSGESYGIMNSFQVHFGIGTATSVDSLIVRWPNGNVDKQCSDFNLNQMTFLDEANFPNGITPNFTYTEVDSKIFFADASSGVVTSWNWDFGDGNTSTDENPIHGYDAPGTYLVTLTIGDGCKTETFVEPYSNFPLPVELIDFKAERLSGTQVGLTWTTAREEQLDFYSVEKTKDFSSIEILTQVEGRNNLSEEQYAWVDQKAYAGESYYRLMMTDLSGRIEYSEWQVVSGLHSENRIQVYPNPTDAAITIQSTDVKIERINIYDLSGRLILTTENLDKKVSLDISKFQSAVYFLEVQTVHGIERMPIIKTQD